MEIVTQANIPQTRSYQQEMLDASLKRNVVIALDTGSGKTHIAVLRMKIECEREPYKRSWFIAPTVGLCEQQREVISTCLSVPVGLVSGALQPDQWTDENLWKQLLLTHRIIVSTPQVLLDALRHGYVNMGRDIGLVVFDEAHHASAGHPYNMIMREFYDQCVPRTVLGRVSNNLRPFILGLTASPIFGSKNIEKSFQKIEQNLDSAILAPRESREELAKHVHRPVFKKIVYRPLSYNCDWGQAINVVALSEVVNSLDIQLDPSVISLRHQLESTTDPIKYKRIDQRLSQAIEKRDTFVNKGMRDFLRTAQELCIDIGPWAANWYVFSVVNKALKAGAETVQTLFAERHHNEKAYLVQVLQRVKVEKVDYDRKAIAHGCSPKANEFIAFLLHEKRECEARNETFSGIVFITRRDGALALSELLNHHPCTSVFFSVGTLLGSSESNKRNAFLDITRTMLAEKQSTVLAGFRLGEKNLVVSTAVAEEGIDIQACCSVFRWDLPANMVSWAQSRGRARRKQSSFILMFEDGGSHEQEIRKWESLEQQMIQKYKEDRQRYATNRYQEDDDGDDLVFCIESTGAKVTGHSAISHVAHFCNTLRSVVREDVQPIYDISPPDYPQGYHALLQSGLLRDRIGETPGPYGATLILPRLLQPNQRIYSTEEIHKTKKAARRHAAFKAYVGLHKAGLLNDNLLPLSSSTAPLQEAEVQALLRDAERRDGVANVRQHVDPWSTMLLGNLDEPKSDEWWLNDLVVEGLGNLRMFTRWNVPELDFSSDCLHDPEEGPRKFSIRPVGPATLDNYEVAAAKQYTRKAFSIFYGSQLKWDDLEFAYLFLPPSDATVGDEPWEGRRAWAEGTRSEDSKVRARDHVTVQANLFAAEFNNPSDVFLLVNGKTCYKFKRWRTEKLRADEEEHIRKVYSRLKTLEISYPVIEARPFQARMNFLLRTPPSKSSRKNLILLPQFVSVVLDNKKNTMFALFLPSILRAMFLKLIAFHFQDSMEELSPVLRQIPLHLIQKALMTPAADAHVNYERLECLGDSVLKLITCVQLFAEHPTWPEGFLAKQKDLTVSNVHLASTALRKRLYRWIIRRSFLLKKWMPDYARVVGEEPLEFADDASSRIEESESQSDALLGSEEGSGRTEGEADNLLVKLSIKTLADVVESLIGAAFLSGGYDRSVACLEALSIEVGSPWQPISKSVENVLATVVPLPHPIVHLSYVEVILGYTFTHKMLLAEALMHATSQSDVQSFSYERMEFLGDALLDAVVIEELYRAEAQGKVFSPEEMHNRTAALVNMHFLGFVCLRANVVLDSAIPQWDPVMKQAVPRTEKHIVHFSHCLMHSSSSILEELTHTFARFEKSRKAIETELEKGSAFPWTALAQLQAPKYLSDIVESTLGAAYIDSKGNMDVVKDVLERLGVMKLLRRFVHDDIDLTHPVSRVAEWAAKNQRMDMLEYRTAQRYGQITCTLVMDGVEIESATERYIGKASEDYVRYRVAEASMPILLDKFKSEA